MTNSGFPNVREITPGTFAVNQEFFVDRILDLQFIKGDGNVPNIVNCTVNDHGLEVGDTVTIFGVSTADYNLDIGVSVVNIIGPNSFEYSTTNHINTTTVLNSGDARVLDPYTFDDTVDNLGQFVHLNAGLDASSIIEITKDGINYVQIANGDGLVGDIFRSLILKNGDKLNVRPATGIDIEYGTLYREP